MFLDQRNTKGDRAISDAIIEMKAVFKEELKNRYETIKAAMPKATFTP